MLMWHAELAKKGMQERLAVSEDRLMRITRDDTMTSLVHAKLTLAQTDYDNLELQACSLSSPLFCNSCSGISSIVQRRASEIFLSAALQYARADGWVPRCPPL